jgi:tryptophan synthase alpha chain
MRGIYLVGNYPDRDTFVRCFDAVISAGYEFAEIGVPFSEPVADGPVIASAVQEALDSGVKARDVLAGIRELKKGSAKLYVMTYANIIYNYGLEKFSADFKDLLDGVIIPDLPNDFHKFFYDKGFDVPVVPFVTPESRVEDIRKAAEGNAEFIYFIGIRGITGGSVDLSSPEITERVKQIKSITDKKIVMGFGIKTREDADKAMKTADGFVVGTAAVLLQKEPAKYAEYVKSLV